MAILLSVKAIGGGASPQSIWMNKSNHDRMLQKIAAMASKMTRLGLWAATMKALAKCGSRNADRIGLTLVSADVAGNCRRQQGRAN